ncbi:MAG TPA: lysylphosphatidylglycerol synthase transmembrane domain-containing protein [Nannocystaceae bacterium]|nr:lysylphosphatidylglycerol synthase transmembrane domain-containing protein [Nannocystaceae bacterium]
MNDGAAEPAADPAKAVNWFAVTIRSLLGLGLFAAIIVWLARDAGSITVELHFGAWTVSLVAAGIANAVTARRWQLLSEAMSGSKLPYGVYFHNLASTRVLGQFLPMLVVDLIGRSASLRAAGSRAGLGRLLAPLVLERLLDLVLPAVLLGWVIATLAMDASSTASSTSLAVVVAVFALLAIPLLRPAARLALRAWALARRLLRRKAIVEEPPMIGRAIAGAVTGWSLARFAALTLQYWASGAALGVALPTLVLLRATPVAQLAGLIGITPGALGIQEGGWTAALRHFGVAPGDIVVFMLATRAALIVNFSLLALVSWRWRKA